MQPRTFAQWASALQGVLWLGLILGLLARPALGQGVDTLRITEAEATRVAQFTDARAVALAPNGQLYVADAGPDVVVALSPAGARQLTLGGTGTQTGAFDDPADVDPTNGLTLYVADAGNGRVQRFSEEGQLLETLPIGSDADASQRPVFDVSDDRVGVTGEGTPIGVVSTTTDELRVLDADDGVVRTYDAQRRPSGTVGGFGQRGGALQEPVALALDDRDRLYVADRGHAAVLVYDRFGTFVHRLPLPPRPDVQALASTGEQVWVVSAARIDVLETQPPRAVLVWNVALREPLVDVAVRPDALFLLTATRLLCVPR